MKRIAPASMIVGALVAVGSLAAFFNAQHRNDQQEASLLRSATTQAAALTSSELSNTVSVLDSLATTVTTTNGSPAAFLSAAQFLVHGLLSAGLAKEYLTHYVFFAATGPALSTGTELNPAIIIATHNAGISASPRRVVRLEGNGTAIFAMGAPFVPDGNIVYLQSSLTPLVDVNTTTTSAYHDIRTSLYGSSHPTVVTPGASASAPVPVSGVTWTLVAEARSPLIGGFAAKVPLIIFLLGLALSLSFCFTVELLARRLAHRWPQPDPDMRVATAATEESARPDVEGPVAENVADLADRPAGHGEEGSPPSGSETSLHADWRPDPFGRFEFRRFFLQKPTSVVRNGTTEGYDPVAPLLEQASAESDQAVVGVGSDKALQSFDEAPLEADDAATADAPAESRAKGGNKGSEKIPTEVVADTKENLENMAARLAEAVAEEINELQAIASEMGEHAVNRFSEEGNPTVPAPPSTRPPSTPPTPPSPTWPVPPPPPKTPMTPPTTTAPPSTKAAEPMEPPSLRVQTASPPPSVAKAAQNGPPRAQRRQPAKRVAMASGAFGLASLLWRRHRKRRDRK